MSNDLTAIGGMPYLHWAIVKNFGGLMKKGQTLADLVLLLEQAIKCGCMSFLLQWQFADPDAPTLSLLDRGLANGGRLTHDLYEIAAGLGWVRGLKWLYANGCPWSVTATEAAARSESLEALKFLRGEEERTIVGKDGKSFTLRTERVRKCPWNDDVYDIAIMHKNSEMLRYLLNAGCCLTDRDVEFHVYVASTRFGGVKCLRVVHEYFRNMPDIVGVWAAEVGSLECLQYAHEQGCTFNAGTYRAARYNEHEECMQYLRDNGCPTEEVVEEEVEEEEDDEEDEDV